MKSSCPLVAGSSHPSLRVSRLLGSTRLLAVGVLIHASHVFTEHVLGASTAADAEAPATGAHASSL